MHNHIFKTALSAALALPFAITLCTASAVQAQNFDTTTLNAEAFAVQDSGTVPGASAAGLNSNGASGDVGRTSYKTGEAPGFSGLSGNTSSVTGRQLGGLTNHLSLPYAGTGGLAPVFGLGSGPTTARRFTTILEDPINIGNTSISGLNGGVTTRIGNSVTTVGGLNSSTLNGNISVGGTSVNVSGIENGLLSGF